MSYSISLQLYTLREEMKDDFVGKLKKVAAIGYDGVEFAGYGDLTATELKKHLDNYGLKASASHIGINVLTDNLDKMIEYSLGIGSEYIVLPKTTFHSREEYLRLADVCNNIGEVCHKNGITLCYHNHHSEFDVFDGECGLDILFNNTDSKFLQAEIDIYWAKYAGVDPVECIKKYKNRCPLIHIKDMEDNETRDFAEIGTGTIDIKGIANVAKDVGVKWLTVEQDRCKRPAFESVTISYNNLKKWA